MQAGSWSGDRSRTLRKNGLIAIAVGSFIFAFNVRWERDVSETLEMLANRALVLRGESQSAQAERPAGDNFSFQFPFAKENALPNLHFAAWPDQRLPKIEL